MEEQVERERKMIGMNGGSEGEIYAGVCVGFYWEVFLAGELLTYL